MLKVDDGSNPKYEKIVASKVEWTLPSKKLGSYSQRDGHVFNDWFK